MRMMPVFILATLLWASVKWDDYKAEKIAAYQAQHGGDVCEVKNILNGVECRAFTKEEIEEQEYEDSVYRWNKMVSDAKENKRRQQELADVLIYGEFDK